MVDTNSRQPLRELPARFSLPLIGDTLAFVRDPAGFLQERARELGPVFRIDVFGAATACFVGPEAFALVLDDKNVQRAGANPPHVEELFNPEAVPFLDGEKQRRRKRLLMQAFTAGARDGGERLSRDEVRIETFHFFGAYAAVIGGLSFLAQCLGRYPEVRARAREEIRRQAPSGPLGMAAIRKLEYLDRVCKESRRVAPVLPITFFGKVMRECSFEGVRIPEGHKAVGCIGPTLLDGGIYPAPERFDPDRWLHATDRQQKAWIPHGGGIHTEGHRCAGEALATLMLKTFAGRLLPHFDWSVEGQDLSPTKGKLFATPASGLQVELKSM